MKIFSWMQCKINAKQDIRTPTSVAANIHDRKEYRKQEFSDWPHGLLAIGTFGNKNVTDDLNKRDLHQSEAIIPEEIGDIEKELNLIIELNNSLLDVYQIQRSSSDVLSRGNDSHLHKTSNVINKNSLSFLLKKMFLCSSGLAPNPSLRDPFPESVHEKSRMKKILRTILSKKIYPQSSIPKAVITPKNCLENNHFCVADSDTDSEDEMSVEANDGSRWVNTDSEFIVLEI